MSAVVIISIAGEDGLWVADLGAGTVQPLDAPKAGTLKAVTDLRTGGTVITKGVNLAVVVKSAEQVFSGHYDG